MSKMTSEIYKCLYHYTNLQGLKGILETQSLWGTRYDFLNDYSEGVLFRPKLAEFLCPFVLEKLKEASRKNPENKKLIKRKGGLNAVAKKESKNLVDALCDHIPDFYLTSFTGEHKNPDIDNHGLLSQWRAYGPDGGFAIVFGARQLEKMMQREWEEYDYSVGHLSDVVYSNDEKKFQEELSESLSDIVKYADDLIDNIENGLSGPPDGSKAFPAVVRCITRYKHWGFKEENEVRLVALPEPHDKEYIGLCKKEGINPKPEKFVEHRDKNVPYIKFFGFPDEKLPIERIIVGPHKEKNERVSMLKAKLKNTGITITPSKIPFAS